MVSSNEAKPLDETKHYFVSSDARLCCRPGPVGCCLCSSWWLHWSWGHVQEYAGRVNFAPISKYHLLYSIVIWSWGHVQEYAGICALPFLLIGEIEIVWQMHPETMHHAKMAANMAKKFAFEQVGAILPSNRRGQFLYGGHYLLRPVVLAFSIPDNNQIKCITIAF